ncbi:CpaF family protein [Leucobacter denitrificans]|uniref:Flp pilus assembly complex ATPase component TadA n=1 Tax=Leucobacter denitrificans TaxID=683042 RepID=A0A7G9S746_9MICO|nr:ATPase, T2SS/T4P/T4SS family [Leucobacter denitrificans]QNN63671.1 Flp pilus assembly complex ATPase component TadA [Leucobacter denitrificans]
MSLRSTKLGTDVRRVLGGLLPLIDDPTLRDLMIHVQDGAGRLFLDRGSGAEHVRGWVVPEDMVNRFAIALIAAGGRHLDELNPCADVRLGDGIRVHAVLAPVAAFGTVVSIRVPATQAASFDELVSAGLCGHATASMLARDVVDRRNLLITGGTGSGKTTLLTSLLSLVHPSERIITIEDVAELRPRHDHHIALETRQTNIEGAGEVSLERLLREALRMRPDRIVLGECRGAEIATLLAALNTGHEGGAGTLHANSLRDVPARLEALGFLAGLPPEALAPQVVSAFHTIVHVSRHAGHHRIEQVGRFTLGASSELGVEVREIGSA